MLREYSFREKAYYFVSDNASKNTATTRSICDRILPSIPFLERRPHCTGHIIQLVADAILDSSALTQLDREALKDDNAKESTLLETAGPK